MSFRPELVLAIAGLGLLFPPATGSVEGIELDLGEVSGSGWQIQDARAEMQFSEAGAAALALRLGRLDHPDLPFPIQDAELRCAAIEVADTQIRCLSGELSLQHPLIAVTDATFAFVSDPEQRTGEAEMKGLILGEGEIQGSLTWDQDAWQAQLEGSALSAGALSELVRNLFPDFAWRTNGRAEVTADVRGDQAGPRQLGIRLVVANLDLADETGRYLGEKLAVRAEAELKRANDSRWHGPISLELAQGGLLTPYLYLDAAEALRLRVDLDLDPSTGTIDLARVGLTQAPLLNLTGNAGLTLGPLRLERITLQTGRADLEGLYQRYFQPVLTETLLEDVIWEGGLNLSVDWRRGRASRVTAELAGVGIEDRYGEHLGGAKRFGLKGLSGRLSWTSGAAPEPSVLTWSGGHLLETLSFGPLRATIAFHEGSLVLSEPVELPVLDGSIMIDRLEFGRHPGRPDRLDFDGALTPISMEGLSAAIGWPALSGTLSGIIPGLSYENGALGIEGTLLVRLFDGRILIRDLELRNLFGALPTLTTNLEVRDLDLEMLTRTFAFGRITGKLEGDVKGLRLESWHPVTFDARLATPAGDDTPHRINQKAVENISALGGGLSGAVSRGFLGIFKDFNYDRLGISCRLQDGVCEMGGVAPAEQGYYLVVGAGIPQINVIGFNHRIDWSQLIERLSHAVETGAPVVQ